MADWEGYRAWAWSLNEWELLDTMRRVHRERSRYRLRRLFLWWDAARVAAYDEAIATADYEIAILRGVLREVAR